MKKLFALLTASVLFFGYTKAQCLTHVKYSASSMQVLDSTMQQVGSKDVSFVMEVTEKGFTATQDGQDDDAFHGTLKKLTCDWKEPYKNGKIIMICDVHTNNEDIVDADITIEAVDGKITITMHAKEHANEILKLAIDKYDEVK